ncbi:DUF6755 family protein [Aeoliella sp. SH292]|jgi:hypothetical protein|uniref:DUF6755 family protein n=1 Tax=Aeoliella sp. SH292 TaxID=3454464 RepID=UPI003F9BA622
MNDSYSESKSTGGDRSAMRAQRMTVVYGITSFILVLVIGQIWLVTASVNAYLGGNDAIVLPAAIASVIGLFLNLGLLRYLYLLEQ